RSAGDFVGGEEYAARRAGAEQALDAIAAGDDFAIAARFALGCLIAPLAQVRIQIGRNVGVARAQLEQRIARAVAQAHRGERRDQVALRLGAKIGVLASVLQEARRLGVRATPRE